jgi:hypothetical protein
MIFEISNFVLFLIWSVPITSVRTRQTLIKVYNVNYYAFQIMAGCLRHLLNPTIVIGVFSNKKDVE